MLRSIFLMRGKLIPKVRESRFKVCSFPNQDALLETVFGLSRMDSGTVA